MAERTRAWRTRFWGALFTLAWAVLAWSIAGPSESTWTASTLGSPAGTRVVTFGRYLRIETRNVDPFGQPVPPGMQSDWSWRPVRLGTTGVTLAVLGFLMFTLARRMIGKHRLLGRCDECGYAATGLTEDRCPECGASLIQPPSLKQR